MNMLFAKIILRTFELMRPGEYPTEYKKRMRPLIWCLVNYTVTMILFTLLTIRDGMDAEIARLFIVQVIESGYLALCIRYKRINLEVARVLNLMYSVGNTIIFTVSAYELFSGNLLGDRYDDLATWGSAIIVSLLFIIELYIRPLWRDRKKKSS